MGTLLKKFTSIHATQKAYHSNRVPLPHLCPRRLLVPGDPAHGYCRRSTSSVTFFKVRIGDVMLATPPPPPRVDPPPPPCPGFYPAYSSNTAQDSLLPEHGPHTRTRVGHMMMNCVCGVADALHVGCVLKPHLGFERVPHSYHQ